MKKLIAVLVGTVLVATMGAGSAIADNSSLSGTFVGTADVTFGDGGFVGNLVGRGGTNSIIGTTINQLQFNALGNAYGYRATVGGATSGFTSASANPLVTTAASSVQNASLVSVVNGSGAVNVGGAANAAAQFRPFYWY